MTRFNDFLLRLERHVGPVSQTELARLLGVNRSAVTQAKNRDTVPEKWLLSLARRLNLDPLWLQDGAGSSLKGREIFLEIPKVEARLCAGGGSFETQENVLGYYAFQEAWLRSKGSPGLMVLMDIVGNSMEPELRSGDTVLIDQSRTAVLSGGIYALGVEESVMVKRLEQHPGRLVLHSDNRDYSPLFLQGDELDTVRIIGRVIWTCRDLV